jgi:hypothetical protein
MLSAHLRFSALFLIVSTSSKILAQKYTFQTKSYTNTYLQARITMDSIMGCLCRKYSPLKCFCDCMCCCCNQIDKGEGGPQSSNSPQGYAKYQPKSQKMMRVNPGTGMFGKVEAKEDGRSDCEIGGVGGSEGGSGWERTWSWEVSTGDKCHEWE